MSPLVRPFAALRPRADTAAAVIAPPYDVVDATEARALAQGRPHSFLRVSRPEIDFAPGTSPYEDRVYARGDRTEGNLRELGLRNVEPAADLAFTLGTGEAPGDARRWFTGDRARDRIVVVPSSVVQGYVDERGGDYVGLMAGFVDALAGLGCEVLIVPHSARPGARASRMNDLPVCRAIHRRLAAPDREVEVFDQDEAAVGEVHGAHHDVSIGRRHGRGHGRRGDGLARCRGHCRSTSGSPSRRR